MYTFKNFLKEVYRVKLIDYLFMTLCEGFSASQLKKLEDKFGTGSLPLIKQFDDLRAANRKEVQGVDIYSFKTSDDLSMFLNKIGSSKSTIKKTEKLDGAKLVFENEKCSVYLITSKKASCSYGANTKWCITAKDAAHWESYNDKGVTFYFIIDKGQINLRPEWQKIAVAKYPEALGAQLEVYDAKDDLIKDFNSMFKLFGLNPNIFKEYIDPNNSFTEFKGIGKFKYTLNGNVKVYTSININNKNLTSLPNFS